MKVVKKILFVLIICLFIMINSEIVFADMAHISYNSTNLIIAKIMKLTIIFVILAYIIFQIRFLKKSNKQKNEKVKKSILMFIITIVVILGLWFGANQVLDAGITYTSSPMRDFNLPILQKNREII